MTTHTTLLDHTYLNRLEAWGRASSSLAYLHTPSTAEQLAECFAQAKKAGTTVAFKGGGNSYGDAFSNSEQVVIDLSRMNRIVAWDPTAGVITVEPGVTIWQLWQYVLGDGWWPPVVTGTAKTTVGGCAAMNTHGKNGWQMGTFGDHTLSFQFMLPSGEILTCSRTENSDIFHTAIGSAGMLGCFVSLTLQMKRIYSGLLEVEAIAQPNMKKMVAYFHQVVDSSDYLVGWVDAFAGGRSLGRGEIHRANYLHEGEDPEPQRTIQIENQHLPELILGLFPKSILWLFARPLTNNLGFRLVNMAKYYAAVWNNGHKYHQSHVAFHFLLDYMPNWKYSYGPGGLIQYQVFAPQETAEQTFTEIFRLCQQKGLPNYLSVLKRHRPDDFLLTYSLDGFSMAMDFQITNGRRPKMIELTRQLDEIVLKAGGHFYFAKDSTLRPEVARAYLGEEKINTFWTVKRKCDPDNIIQTDLWRRVFGA